MLIDFLRHGEPVGGRAYRGNRIDDPLSELGWRQMWQAVPAELPWQQIVTSPLARCREFASTLAEKHDLPVTIEEDFREVGFGEWEGRTPDEIIADNADEYEAFYRDPVNCRPAGAEPLDEFVTRVTRCFEQLLHPGPAGHTLVVTHAGVIRAVVSHVLETPPAAMYRIKIENARITRISSGPRGLQLEKLNYAWKQVH